jgi:hypothetical protein
MAYLVARPRGTWELRESRTTESGPRSRTLVSFRELDDEVLATVVERATGALDADQVRELCRRAGVHVARSAADRAAAALLREIGRGNKPSPTLGSAVGKALAGEGLTDAEHAAAEWADASPERRGRAIWDLLLLADHIPVRPRPEKLAFPPLGAATS